MRNIDGFCSVVGDLFPSLNCTAKNCLSPSYGQIALLTDFTHFTQRLTDHCHICMQTIFVDTSVESSVYMGMSMPCVFLLILVTFSVSIYHEENIHGDRTVQLIN